MRELAVRVRFTKHSLGNVKAKDKSGRFLLPRGTSGQVIYLATWHRMNMQFAAKTLGLHYGEVGKICWDINVDAVLPSDRWYRRFYTAANGKQRFILHETFMPGQVVGFNCVVPSAIGDEDFWRLMQLAGQYKGLSPWKPGEWGFFEVESILPRRGSVESGPVKETGVSEVPVR